LQAKAEGPFAFKYFIVSGDPGEVFSINENGQITTTAPLDREQTPAYSLVVAARGVSKIAYTTVNITILDLNDNDPLFEADSYIVNVPEDSPVGTTIFVAKVSY